MAIGTLGSFYLLKPFLKMKILILSHKFSPDIGGIETITEILAEEFTKKGLKVIVATWSRSVANDLLSYEVIRNPSLKKLMSITSWADIVFENNPCIRLSWPSLLLNKPTVVAIHTWITQPDGTMTWVDKIKKIKLKMAASVIAVSEKLKEGTFKKAIVISNPFKAELFSSSNSIKDRDFIFLGRLVSDKGADLAIEALARLHKENKMVFLTIVGEGPEKDHLKQQVFDLDLSKYVTFTGSLVGPELVNEISRHRFMMVPSKWREPFGIVALESIACGCIPIVADGGGLPDAVGKAGIVFQRGNLNDLVKKINMLMARPDIENQLKGAAYNQIENHQPSKIAEKYLNVFQKVYQRSK